MDTEIVWFTWQDKEETHPDGTLFQVEGKGFLLAKALVQMDGRVFHQSGAPVQQENLPFQLEERIFHLAEAPVHLENLLVQIETKEVHYGWTSFYTEKRRRRGHEFRSLRDSAATEPELFFLRSSASSVLPFSV